MFWSIQQMVLISYRHNLCEHQPAGVLSLLVVDVKGSVSFILGGENWSRVPGWISGLESYNPVVFWSV
jgi:hypothetical protein